MDTRCCRICWNDEDWKKPAGVARDVEQGNSYASREGFGFEEWFFDYGMIDDNGYKYGFLQPLFGQNYDSYAGKDYDIVLYTLVPKNSAFYQSGRYFVAKISNCHILTPSEFKQVYEIYRQKNWLDKMKRQLKRLGLDPNQVDVEKESLFNIRFREKDVNYFSPMRQIPCDHTIMRMDRYQVILGGM